MVALLVTVQSQAGNLYGAVQGLYTFSILSLGSCLHHMRTDLLQYYCFQRMELL